MEWESRPPSTNVEDRRRPGAYSRGAFNWIPRSQWTSGGIIESLQSPFPDIAPVHVLRGRVGARHPSLRLLWKRIVARLRTIHYSVSHHPLHGASHRFSSTCKEADNA